MRGRIVVTAGALLLGGCAAIQADWRSDQPAACFEFDPAKVGDIALLDRENEQHKARMASVAWHFFNQFRTAGRVRLFEGSHGYGNGEQRRDFVHVRDVARAFRLALEQPHAPGHVVNIGSGQAYTISQVARLLAQAMGLPEIEPEFLGKARSGDIRNCFADISRARELLGFSPQLRLENSLDELAEWIGAAGAVDRGFEMRRNLEERGLVL